jgi:hypothetical protein
MFLNVILLFALPEHAAEYVDLREDLRGPVLGSPFGGLTGNTTGSAPRHGDGTTDRTATFLNVVLLLALPERACENMDLSEDLRGPFLGSSLGGLTRNPSGSAPRHGDGTAGRTATFLNVVLLLAPFERAHGCLDLREDLHGPVLGSPLGGLTRNPSGSAPSHGDGTAGRTVTFLNVVFIFPLPGRACENVDLCKDLRVQYQIRNLLSDD